MLYRNYSSFNWGNIGEFVTEGDDSEEITLLMDILIIFYMSWVERDWTLISDIDLSSGVHVSGINNYCVKSINPKVNRIINSYIISTGLVISSVIISFFLRFQRRTTQEQKKWINIKQIMLKDAVKRKNFIKSIIKILQYVTFIIIFDIFLLYN